MNHREGVLAAVEHEEPDRVPIDFGGSSAGIHVKAYEELKNYLGFKSETALYHMWQQLAYVDEPVLERFDTDTRHVLPSPLPARPPKKVFPDGSYVDSWGVKRARAGYYYDIPSDGHPLRNASIDDVDRYDWPDPHEGARKAIEYMRERVKRLYEETDYALVYSASANFFETSWCLTGFQRFFTDLIRDPSFVCKVMDKVLEYGMKFESEVLPEIGDYIDIVRTSDDLGMQNGPLLSPEMYRKYIKPRQKKAFQLIKSKTDAKIFLHSCGSISVFLDDLAEIGVDIINPVQVSAKNMDTKMLKEKFGDKLCFWGAVDTQRVLPFGTVKEVEEEVKKRIKDLAPNGGYVLCAVHNIQPGVPPENVVAMYDSAKKWGSYPIT